MKIRIIQSVWHSLCEKLLERKDVETAGVLMGELIPSSSGEIIVIREAIVATDSDYLVRKVDQLSIDPVALNRITKPARVHRWAVFTIHTHPGAKEPWFSKADDVGDARLMPSLHNQIPGIVHGSFVLASSGHAVGRVFDEQGNQRAAALYVIGKSIQANVPRETQHPSWFHRQQLALGAAGQSHLRQLRVGVVGLGGIGSLVSMQLSHLGIGSMVLIDGDTVEDTNVPRLIGVSTLDCGSPKVDIAARYAKSIGLVQGIETYFKPLEPADTQLIASCDVVMSCVDTHSARALLNRLCYRYLVPVVDMGTVFRVNEDGGMISDAGRVVVIGPDRPCLCCWGHIDPDAIRRENQTPEEIEQEIQEGYIQGAQVAQPSVISFNTAVAGLGVCELVRLVTGFSGMDNPPNRLAFSFSEGVVRRNALALTENCTVCSRV